MISNKNNQEKNWTQFFFGPNSLKKDFGVTFKGKKILQVYIVKWKQNKNQVNKCK